MSRSREPVILLVDDDEVDVMNVRRALGRTRSQAKLHVAADGVEALRMLRETPSAFDRPPNILMIDLNMPRMTGLELLAEVRADPALGHLQVVALTTSDDPADVHQAHQLNVAAYIVKPLTYERFVEVMAVLVRFWSVVELP